MIDLRHARKTLLELQARLERRLGGRPEAEAHADVYDQARAGYERETRAFDVDRIRGRLAEVRAAIQRVTDGSYGDCERCGEAIGKKRIEAIPETAHCLPCAEVLERQARAAARSSGTPADEDC